MKKKIDIKACIRQEAQACKLFYETYLPYLLTIVRRYGITAHDEADYIQEIYVELFSSLEKYNDKRGALSTWIRTIAVRKILNLKRSKHNSKVVALEDYLEHKEVSISYDRYDAEYLLKAIKSLPLGYRNVFNLYEIDGFSHKEISEMLQISTSSSRSQLTRAKKALITILHPTQKSMEL